MTDDTPKIIPFGKHREKPIQILQQDAAYRDWLMQQNWFRDRHESIYQLIVNNFGEPTETPEHNAMQARFLNDELCIGLLRKLGWEPFDHQGNGRLLRSFEERGWDVSIRAISTTISGGTRRLAAVCLELKPFLGDDYPAVLRQMRAAQASGDLGALVVGQFTAIGATLEQVRAIFEQSGFHLVMMSEIEGESE